MFGSAGAPNSAVIVGQYQDRTHRCNENGQDLGIFVNVKFTGANSATVSGVALTSTGHTLATIPQNSGTLLCRFAEPNSTAVVTQNATFRAINLTATSGAPNIADIATGITIKAAQLADTNGNAGNAAWSNIDSSGGTLSLSDQSGAASIHDYHLIISVSPTGAGRKINFAYVLLLEFI